jgi:hypothetical protein
MKLPPRLSMPRMLVLIAVAGALSSCSTDKTYLSRGMTLSDLSTINPRGYLDAFTPHDREMAIMEMQRSAFRR